MLRSHKIKRHSNKCFYLEVLQGHGNSRQLFKYDLGFTVKEAKENFLKKVETIRLEELPAKDRKTLLESITEDIELDEPYVVITSQGHVPNKKYIPLPGETASNSFGVTIPGTLFIGY